MTASSHCGGSSDGSVPGAPGLWPVWAPVMSHGYLYLCYNSFQGFTSLRSVNSVLPPCQVETTRRTSIVFHNTNFSRSLSLGGARSFNLVRGSAEAVDTAGVYCTCH